MLKGRSDIKKACLICLIRLHYSLILFPPFLPFVLLWSFLTASNAICSTLLFSVTLPLASLAVRNTGGDVCSPGMGVLHLERAGAAQPQSWSCCTFAGLTLSHCTVWKPLYCALLPLHSPICASLVLKDLLSWSFFLSLASTTSFISRLPFLAHDCWKY